MKNFWGTSSNSQNKVPETEDTVTSTGELLNQEFKIVFLRKLNYLQKNTEK
jgi:hypothetical protein